MPQPLTVKNLEGVIDCLKGVQDLYKKNQTGPAFMEWPEKFPVMSDDGYSLGNIYYEDEWVFEAHE